jgi:VRR-NUC domain
MSKIGRHFYAALFLYIHQMKYNEKHIHKQCVLWFARFYPSLFNRKLLFHTPNGARRGVVEAAELKRMGMQAGIPDLILLIPNDVYHALLIEIKTPDTYQSKEQKEFEKQIVDVGYCYSVCKSVDEFISLLQHYLKGTKYHKKTMYK